MVEPVPEKKRNVSRSHGVSIKSAKKIPDPNLSSVSFRKELQ